MEWTVRLSPEAEKQLSRLPRDRQELIAKSIDGMRAEPFHGNAKALKGKQWEGRFRRAVGRYRLIFLPDHSNRVIEISQILIRSEKTYR